MFFLQHQVENILVLVQGASAELTLVNEHLQRRNRTKITQQNLLTHSIIWRFFGDCHVMYV